MQMNVLPVSRLMPVGHTTIAMRWLCSATLTSIAFSTRDGSIVDDLEEPPQPASSAMDTATAATGVDRFMRRAYPGSATQVIAREPAVEAQADVVDERVEARPCEAAVLPDLHPNALDDRLRVVGDELRQAAYAGRHVRRLLALAGRERLGRPELAVLDEPPLPRAGA